MHRQQLSVSSSESIMAFQNCLRTLTFFLGLLFHSSFAIEPPDSDKPQKPYFAFSWANDNNTFQAGDTAAIKIIVLGEFDSKGNASLGKSSFNPILTVNGKIGNSSFVSGVFLDTAGDTSTWKILFTPIRVGVFNVFIEDEPFEVFDSSLHFNAVAGQIYPSVCIASWMGVLNEYEAGAKATVFIVPRDAFGNNVSSAGEDLNPHNFSVSALYANGSLASVPNVTHIGWNEFGFIIIEFIAAKAGNLLLHVKGGNQTLIGSPLPFKVNPGSLDVLNCLPKWKFETNAWQIFSKMEIFIYQQDQYENLVSGLHEFDADITEKETNLSIPISDLYFEEVVPGIQLFSFSLLEPGNFLLTISDLKHNKSISNMPFAYNVFIGYCDGSASIVNGSGLNDSIAGEIAEFSLYLVDVFQYPAFVEVESIQVQIARENDSYYVQPSIHPIINGSEPARELSYRAIKQTEVAPDPSIFPRNVSTGRLKILASSFNVIYKPEKSGIYEIHVFCGNILLGGGHLFRKEVTAGEYFPKAYDDTISVREDESIAVDVLANDYFAGNNASIVEFSKPDRGSLLQYGHLFRYTPYQGYYGNDSFMYTISDVNGNLASASVNISVSNIPPQFISFPSQLQATEDMLTPRLGGFAGFEISYSDPLENISVTLSADSGTLFLYPMPVQFWQTTWGEFSVKEDDDGARSLIIEGCVDVINLALQSIQYLGNDNFSGNDTIRLSASNINGKNELEVPAFVEPINDPPFINIPKFITLEGNGGESLIFNKARDKFAFCVGDPDLLNFPAKDKSHFLVKFSLEVDDGFLVTSLPAELINTTELKLMNSYQWLPLQTYVTISKHFTVKASGIRFWGTIYDCNLVLQNLLYNGGEHGVVLTVKLNDMGNYGCYSDCTERISMPLQAEATVNLIRSRPMSSLAVHTLGSVVFIEFLMVLSLGVALLFFTFKCAFHLVNERKGHKIENAQQSTVQNIQKESSSNNTSTYFTSCCSRLLSHQTQSSNFRQRSHHRFGIKESGEDICGPSESTHGNHPQTLPSFMPLAIEKGF
ncbi:protein GAMETE EXPRESSED 2 isoform X3 [Jatropha curcas]|uniref:protein GAMETE EXPRESSED 2 isoform X3 n=1 Tax=Jatropha curcas TaxID=180498 RepID=UPI0018939C42|nr:protein GAMETE EXPRESSED 2 isoform X3 [Jatropha curcas]